MNEIIKPAMRRSDKSKELEAAGVSGAALEALLSETAAERQMDRIRYTADLAEKKVLAEGVPARSALAAMAGLLVADLCGVGGRMDVEGAATERILAEAGKGRWQASDGQAYRAAVKHIDRMHRFASRRLAAGGQPRRREPHPAADFDNGAGTLAVARETVEQIAVRRAEPAFD